MVRSCREPQVDVGYVAGGGAGDALEHLGGAGTHALVRVAVGTVVAAAAARLALCCGGRGKRDGGKAVAGEGDVVLAQTSGVSGRAAGARCQVVKVETVEDVCVWVLDQLGRDGDSALRTLCFALGMARARFLRDVRRIALLRGAARSLLSRAAASLPHDPLLGPFGLVVGRGRLFFPRVDRVKAPVTLSSRGSCCSP